MIGKMFMTWIPDKSVIQIPTVQSQIQIFMSGIQICLKNPQQGVVRIFMVKSSDLLVEGGESIKTFIIGRF